MGVLYVAEQGATLRRTGERLLVVKEDKLLDDVPLVHVEQVVIYGNIQISTPAVALLLQKEIDVVFLSSYGKYRGRLVGTGSKFAELRHRQLHVLEDDELVLRLARELVIAKLSGQAAMLERWSVHTAAGSVRRAIQQARQATSIDSLRGHEGSSGAAYFCALQSLFPAKWGFTKRIYHPPTDRVNSLLSLGYTLLLKDITAAVHLVGLDPYAGVFHALEQGRPSLCLDLMEPYRPVVDDVVVRLVREGQIPWEAFERRKKDGAMLLDKKARKHYFQTYEERMAQRVDAGPEGQTTLKRSMELQARRWARVVMGTSKSFVPFAKE